MPRELSLSQRVRLLRRAVELGLVSREEAEVPLEGAADTFSEVEAAAAFDRLAAWGRLPESFLQAELGELDTDRTLAESSGAGLSRGIRPQAEGPGTEGFPMPPGGRYAPLAFIGDGGMGRVFKAFDQQLQRVVALKFLKRLEPEALDRFLLEGRAQAQIEHPHVANVYSVGQVEGQPYLAMRFVDGPSLKAALPTLSLEQKVRILRDVAEALHACHRLGIIHRDVKPTNVMLERTEAGEWWPFVMDFGLARELGSESLTVTGVIVGTPIYCSPEQVQGRMEEVDRRSDVYALGATLYECLCGAPPYSAIGGLVELVRRISEDDPIALDKRIPNLPRDLVTIVGKAMEKDPQRRYDSARALAEDLQRFLDGDPIQARAATVAYRLATAVRRNRVLAAVIGISSILVLGLGALGLTLAVKARVQAQSAQRFGREVEMMEGLLFKVYSLPLHDVRPGRRIVEERLARLRAELARQGRWSRGPGHLALGRGYMALGRHEEARTELEAAWRLSGSDPEVAHALGLTLARLYQEELEGLRGKPREDRKRELSTSHSGPALDLLRRSRGLPTESAAYVEGVIARVEERFSDALLLARQAQEQVPWSFEAWILEADVHRDLANLALTKGDFSEAEGQLDTAGRALAQAQAIGRSAPAAYEGEVQRLATRFQLRTDRGQGTPADRDAALGAVERALQADPESWRALGYKSSILRRWATLERDRGGDPGPWLGAAVQAAEDGLRGRPEDTPLLNNLGTALRYLADWEAARGQDPRPTLERAVQALERAMARPQFMDFLLNNLGNCFALQAEWEMGRGLDPTGSIHRAAGHFARAMELRPWVGHASSQGSTLARQALWEQWQGRDPQPPLQAALKAFAEAERLNPNSFQTHLWRARAILRLAVAQALDGGAPLAAGDLALARESLLRVQALNPKAGPDLGLMGVQIRILEARSGAAATAAALQALGDLERDPEALGQAADLAETHLLLPGRPSLPASLRKALEGERRTKPWSAAAPLAEGRLLAREGRRREAEAALDEAMKRNPALSRVVSRIPR